MKKLAAAAALLVTTLLASCEKGNSFKIPGPKDLQPGGVFISYNLGCEAGCDQVQKGDLLQKIDGQPVKTSAEFDKVTLTDGKPHKLELLAWQSHEPKSVDITASPNNKFPPLKDLGPFYAVGAEELDAAPEWARRRMFGHTSPMVQLVSINGGILDGRQLYGKKRFMVYWDWGDRQEEGYAVAFMQVLQKAFPDLQKKDIDLMFVHVKFPTGRKEPMNDTDLRAWADKWSVKVDGQKLPMIPFYRRPNKVEFNEARELGMENAYTTMENLGQSPTILLMDERGIIRWHSEGLQMPDGESKITQQDQYTIISAVDWAMKNL